MQSGGIRRTGSCAAERARQKMEDISTHSMKAESRGLSIHGNWNPVLKILYNDPFGSRRIDKVRTMDAKAWLVKLQQEDHRGYSSIQTIRGVLRPAFAMAVEDDLLVKNQKR